MTARLLFSEFDGQELRVCGARSWSPSALLTPGRQDPCRAESRLRLLLILDYYFADNKACYCGLSVLPLVVLLVVAKKSDICVNGLK